MNWQGAFWIATALPLTMLPFAYFGLPESLRFLAAKDPAGAETAALVRTLQPEGAEAVTIVAAAPAEKGKAPRTWPFGGGMTATTLLLWLAFMCSFTYISGASWKTTVFRDVIGLPWSQVAATTALGTAGGAVGMLIIGAAIDRFGFRAVVPTFYFIAAAATLVIGFTAPTMTMYVALAVMGAFQHGAHAGLVSLASAIYPTSSRATGVGWAYGAGRGASIFGPLLIAGALHRELGPVGIFCILAAPLALTGACVFFLASRPLATPTQRLPH
jgi:AAHS family 4-hydroxybenzoate transporter-like MFS transporter